MTVSLADLIRTRPPERGPIEAVWTPPPIQTIPGPRLDFIGRRDLQRPVPPPPPIRRTYVPPPVVERYPLLTSRSMMDWGDAPKYNEAYRRIRWPGGQKIEYVVGEMAPRYAAMAPEDRPQFTKPYWMVSLRQDQATKRGGRWTHIHRQSRLRSDLFQCMKENIPFTTNTLFYNPADQWIYVNGNRTIKYDLRTGYISEFTYSGVYNKVTSLMLRMVGIKVRLVKGKLFWFGRYGSQAHGPLESLPVDINTLYHYTAFGQTEGFVQIDYALSYEMRRRRNEEHSREALGSIFNGVPIEDVTVTLA